MKKYILPIILVIVVGLAAFFTYKTVTRIKGYDTIDDVSKIVDTDETLSITFGIEDCIHCKNFKKVLNEVAAEKQVHLYYVDANDIDEDHNYIIPLKCADKANQKLTDGFGTPLTLFIKDNKPIDCISGEVTATALKSKLRSVEIIKK